VDAGYQIQYVPSVVASHSGGHSIRKMPSGCRAVAWCVSLLTYAAKHFGSLGYRGVCAAMVLSSVPRMFAGMIQERSLLPVATYCRIVRIAGLCLVSVGRRGKVRQTNS
jgi:GT2 family glycosyltransferase